MLLRDTPMSGLSGPSVVRVCKDMEGAALRDAEELGAETTADLRRKQAGGRVMHSSEVPQPSAAIRALVRHFVPVPRAATSRPWSRATTTPALLAQ